MKKLINLTIQKTSWRIAAMFTLLFAAFYILANYSGIGVAGLLKITGGANILDFEFGYSKVEAYQMLTALGAEGRDFYLKNILPIDFPLPLSYMLFFASWISLLLKHITRCRHYVYLLCIPVLAALSDWVENIGIISMLKNYPNQPSWAVTTASCAGMLKTIFTIGSIAAIGILLCVFFYKRKRQY